MQVINADLDMSPLKKQKEFINQIAEDFVYSKQRNLKKYRESIRNPELTYEVRDSLDLSVQKNDKKTKNQDSSVFIT